MKLNWRGVILAGLVATAAGCGSTTGEATGPTAPTSTPTLAAASAASAATATPRAPAGCPPPASVLDGVYHPDRLIVLGGCQRVTGTVEVVRHEQDGDVHYDVRVDASYRRLLSAGNQADQHGWLVVELMPRDGGHLPEPSAGDRVALIGAWVDDTAHSWHEIHPVWYESINGGPGHRSGPRFGGSPSSDRSFDAAEDCRTPSGARCRGYGPSLPAPSASAPSGHASCRLTASYNSTYHDYDVYVHSNQPDVTVTVSDTNGDSRTWHTDRSGYADVFLRVSGDAAAQRVTARVGGAACSAGLQLG